VVPDKVEAGQAQREPIVRCTHRKAKAGQSNGGLVNEIKAQDIPLFMPVGEVPVDINGVSHLTFIRVPHARLIADKSSVVGEN